LHKAAPRELGTQRGNSRTPPDGMITPGEIFGGVSQGLLRHLQMIASVERRDEYAIDEARGIYICSFCTFSADAVLTARTADVIISFTPTTTLPPAATIPIASAHDLNS
jgi:hypothetical protein